ncbi:MAG: hypothetical protein IT456_19185 [Planctomycetes bacterium]|mgnify:FL=1|nr:hypothetical protein [Planctomycetota bacterium]
MATDKELELMRKRLRTKLRASLGDVAVPHADLDLLLEEIGRLQQSNERLRRQNRRVRLKLQKAGLVEGLEDGGGEGVVDAPDVGTPDSADVPDSDSNE